MNIYYILIVTFFLASTNSFAQSKRSERYFPAQHAVYIGAGGAGLITLSFECLLNVQQKSFWLLGMDIGNSIGDFGIMAHSSYNYQISSSNNHVELGFNLGAAFLGNGISITGKKGNGVLDRSYQGGAILGYRLHPSRGFSFKVQVNPLLVYSNNQQQFSIQPNGSISFGYCFQQ